MVSHSTQQAYRRCVRGSTVYHAATEHNSSTPVQLYSTHCLHNNTLTSLLALSMGKTDENTRSGLGLPHRRRKGVIAIATTPSATPEEKVVTGDLTRGEETEGTTHPPLHTHTHHSHPSPCSACTLYISSAIRT